MTGRGKSQSKVSVVVEGGEQQRLRKCGLKGGKEREHDKDIDDDLGEALVSFEFAQIVVPRHESFLSGLLNNALRLRHDSTWNRSLCVCLRAFVKRIFLRHCYDHADDLCVVLCNMYGTGTLKLPIDLLDRSI